MYRLKVQQGVHRLGLGIVVLLIHVSSVLGSPLRDDDGQSWGVWGETCSTKLTTS